MRVADTLGVCNSRGVACAQLIPANRHNPEIHNGTRMKLSESDGDAGV